MPDGGASPRAAFEADLAACREALRGGSHTFYAASLILPRPVRGPASALYAFCRLADDAIDLADDPVAALAALRERLDLAYAGNPLDTPADRAFAATVAHFAIPRELPEALLDGFAWDAEGRDYPDFESVCDYGARVAGAVGAMMALVMGVRAPDALARACELGIAMQLTNIARDVGEDARMGRLYLPGDWMREAGLDPDAWLAAPQFDARLGRVVRRLLAAADELYARGASGIVRLPAGCRPAIRAAAALYAEIGREVARRGHDSVTGRAIVPPMRKVAVLGRSALSGGARAGLMSLPPVASARFLVEAVARTGHRSARAPVAWWQVEARTIRILELFERMAERDRLGATRP